MLESSLLPLLGKKNERSKLKVCFCFLHCGSLDPKPELDHPQECPLSYLAWEGTPGMPGISRVKRDLA